MSAELLRKALKLAIAAFLTAAIAVWSVRVAYVWYPLLAVVVVVDDNDEQTFQAASIRVLGTAMGGLVTFLVHSILGGWLGVLVSMLLMLPLLRRLGWQSASGTAALVSLMFLMIPGHEALNWQYVFNRALDTSIGCLIAIGVSLLLWPRGGPRRLLELEEGLRRPLLGQLGAYRRWLEGRGERPRPLEPAGLTATLLSLESLLERETRGPQGQALRRRRWPQRLRLWGAAQHHWITWERLLAGLPDPAAAQGERDDPLHRAVITLEGLLEGRAAAPWRDDPMAWSALADRRDLPVLLLLALAEEQRPLQASLVSLRLLVPWA